jgi:hypothetical protein
MVIPFVVKEKSRGAFAPTALRTEIGATEAEMHTP